MSRPAIGRDRDACDEPEKALDPVVSREPDHRSDDRGCRRARQALEEAPILTRVRVEAREPERSRRAVEEGREPAEAAPRLTVFREPRDAPLISDDRGREPERDHVRQAVVFLAELARRAREPRDAAVEPIEEHRSEDAPRRLTKVAVDRGDDRVEPREQSPRRQQVRQEIDSLASDSLRTAVHDCNSLLRPRNAARNPDATQMRSPRWHYGGERE